MTVEDLAAMTSQEQWTCQVPWSSFLKPSSTKGARVAWRNSWTGKGWEDCATDYFILEITKVRRVVRTPGQQHLGQVISEGTGHGSAPSTRNTEEAQHPLCTISPGMHGEHGLCWIMKTFERPRYRVIPQGKVRQEKTGNSSKWQERDEQQTLNAAWVSG